MRSPFWEGHISPAELDITVQENTLLVTGKAQKEDENGGAYLHRGIARRTFERRFSLADHMKVPSGRSARSRRERLRQRTRTRHIQRGRSRAMRASARGSLRSNVAAAKLPSLIQASPE
jgi:hypothetical protein